MNEEQIWTMHVRKCIRPLLRGAEASIYLNGCLFKKALTCVLYYVGSGECSVLKFLFFVSLYYVPFILPAKILVKKAPCNAIHRCVRRTCRTHRRS